MRVRFERHRRLALPLIFLVAFSVAGPEVARAAKTKAPTPEQAVQPSRNAAEFDTPPWDSATLQDNASKNRDPGPHAQARPIKSTGGPATTAQVRSAKRGAQRVQAAHAGLVICGATPSMTRLGYLISAEGFSSCTNGPADLLYNKNCVDLFSSGGYWTTLTCGEWRSCALCSYIAGYFHARLCTPGRYYRPTSKMSVVHGNTASGSYPGNYIQC